MDRAARCGMGVKPSSMIRLVTCQRARQNPAWQEGHIDFRARILAHTRQNASPFRGGRGASFPLMLSNSLIDVLPISPPAMHSTCATSKRLIVLISRQRAHVRGCAQYLVSALEKHGARIGLGDHFRRRPFRADLRQQLDDRIFRVFRWR